MSRQDGTENCNKAKQQIIQREKDIKEKATQDGIVLSHELDILLKPQNDALHKTKETLQKNIDYLKKTTNNIDQMLHSNDVKFVLDTSFSIEKELPSKDIEGLNVTMTSQVNFIAPVLSIRFGSLVIVPRLAIIQSVQTPLKAVKCVEGFDNGTYVSIVRLQGSYSRTAVQYFQLNDSNYIEKYKSYFKFKSFGIKVIENNTILCLCRTEIKSLSESNEMGTFSKLRVNPFFERVTSFCTTAEGAILLGYSRSQGFGCKFVTHGIKLLNDKGDSKNFIVSSIYCVDKIATSDHGTFILSHSRYKKVVHGLSSIFESKWTYKGHSSTNSNAKFEPTDIAVSTPGLIYVTDSSCNHVLTSDGDLVTNYGKEHGIIDPKVLHINKEGQMIIWCNDGKVHVADISS